MVNLTIFILPGEKYKMKQVSILEAKTDLSKLVRMIEIGSEESIVIARHGKPVVKMMLYSESPANKRIGTAKGKIKVPADFDKFNEEINALFGGAI